MGTPHNRILLCRMDLRWKQQQMLVMFCGELVVQDPSRVVVKFHLPRHGGNLVAETIGPLYDFLQGQLERTVIGTFNHIHLSLILPWPLSIGPSGRSSSILSLLCHLVILVFDDIESIFSSYPARSSTLFNSGRLLRVQIQYPMIMMTSPSKQL